MSKVLTKSFFFTEFFWRITTQITGVLQKCMKTIMIDDSSKYFWRSYQTKTWINEDFPLPTLPTIATSLFGSTFKLIFFKVIFSSPQLKFPCSIFIQDFVSFLKSFSPSSGKCKNFSIRLMKVFNLIRSDCPKIISEKPSLRETCARKAQLMTFGSMIIGNLIILKRIKHLKIFGASKVFASSRYV